MITTLLIFNPEAISFVHTFTLISFPLSPHEYYTGVNLMVRWIGGAKKQAFHFYKCKILETGFIGRVECIKY
jgi:hypothetical protein